MSKNTGLGYPQYMKDMYPMTFSELTGVTEGEGNYSPTLLRQMRELQLPKVQNTVAKIEEPKDYIVDRKLVGKDRDF